MLGRPRGTRDVLPEEARAVRWLEALAIRLAEAAGFGEIRTPMFELAELFDRTSGPSSDVVEKEMYRFRDRADRLLALRPEFTAPVVRALLEAGRITPQMAPLRLWYLGPLFRYDRPEAGRQRQYTSFGVEVLGSPTPLADAECIALGMDLVAAAGAGPAVLRLNSLGDAACRPAYRQALLAYAWPMREELCGTCRRRLEENPLRLLDCKVPADRARMEAAPRTVDHLCAPCRQHHRRLERLLEAAGVTPVPDHRLVRGLDYYTRTVFEVAFPEAGEEGVVLGGGRYDGLVELLGGPPTPAVGMGVGMERLLARAAPPADGSGGGVEAYLVTAGAAAEGYALGLARELRQAGLRVALDLGERSVKAQVRAADRQGARAVVVVGARELVEGRVTLRRLSDGAQETVPRPQAAQRLRELVTEEAEER